MKTTETTLFRAFDIWKRISHRKMIRYRCFHLLPQNKYCVQNAEIYELPLRKDLERDYERQYLEHLLEKDPNVRNKVFFTIEEAIFEYDVEYETLWED